MKVKLAKDWAESKAGDTLDVSDAEGAVLVKGKVGVEMVGGEELELVEKAVAKKVEDGIKQGIKQGLAQIRSGVQSVQIEMGESEEDKLVAKGGYADIGSYAHDVKMASLGMRTQEQFQKFHVALKAVHGMALATPADGGYLAPVEYSSFLMERSLEQEIMRPRAFRVPMNSSSMKVRGLDDYDRSDAAKGGNLGTITAEGGASPAITKLAFEQITLTPVKILVDVSSTPELEEDSPESLTALINRIVPARMSKKIDNYFITGAGTTEPLGCFNAGNPALKVATAAATRTSVESLANMFVGCTNPQASIWVCSRSMYAALLALGSTYFLPFSVNNNIVAPPPGTLLGRPLYICDRMVAAGTTGDIGLVDPSQYFSAERGGMRTASSVSVYWSTDENVYRFAVRIDGKPGWSDVNTGENSETSSPFVTLAT